VIKANISKQETVALTQRLTAATLGILLGAFILMGVGFANADLLHNATHDARHANSFPCH
jgi:cobalt transporter subunit CbtB